MFALKTDNSLFCHRDIPIIHNGYCVIYAVDYAKKRVRVRIEVRDFSTELRGQ